MLYLFEVIISWINKYKIINFEEIDSTNLEAIRIAKKFSPEKNYLIVAKNQTHSKGRNSKNWKSYLGNLHSTILLKHNIDLAYLPQLSFVTSIAAYKTINALPCKTSNNIKVKWPNDILINDKKVSGILLESLTVNNKHYLIIGIGINIKENPLLIDQPTTCLINEKIEVDNPQRLLFYFMDNFEKTFTKWKKEGFVSLRKYWLKRAYNIEKLITVNTGQQKISGIFKDIDSNGHLRLQKESGEVISINSGEVFSP